MARRRGKCVGLNLVFTTTRFDGFSRDGERGLQYGQVATTTYQRATPRNETAGSSARIFYETDHRRANVSRQIADTGAEDLREYEREGV